MEARAHHRAVRRRRAPIVGLAASASSVPALQALFGAISADCELCFVVAMSLDSGDKRVLPDQLHEVTALKVSPARDRQPLEPGHVYVLPREQRFTVERGVFRLSHSLARDDSHGRIDPFFRSLAADQGDRAIAIVLSGTGTEGAIGAREVKAAGGLAIAQTPESAADPDMPNSAIAIGAVDLVLRPERMPEALFAFAAPPSRAGAFGRTPARPDDLQSILSIVRAHTGRDFRGYRSELLWPRIERRMRLQTCRDAGEYAAALQADPDGIDRLSTDLLIDAPVFFRDPPALDEVTRAVLAWRARQGEHDRPLRVWVPGCATGEEAYSIAMVLAEQMELTHPSGTFEILATDADPRAVEVARTGRYPASVAMDLTPARLERFLERDGHRYRIVQSLHRTLTFAVHDLRKDPPLSNIDLVSCRNLLTRLEPEARQEVLSLFHVALRAGGHLFVGRGEGIGAQGPLFDPASGHRQLWQKREPAQRLAGADRDLLAPVASSEGAMDRCNGATLLGASTTGVLELWGLIRRVEAELRESHDEVKTARRTIVSLNEQLKSAKEELRLVSPDVVTVLLDKDIRVKRFTSAASRVLNVTDADVGRGIDDVATTLVDVDLGRHAREVLKTGAEMEEIVSVEDGRRFTLRLLACRHDHREVPLGVLVALVDVSSMTARERHFRLAYDALQHSNDALERRVNERTKWLGLLHQVTRAIGDAPSWDEGLRLALHHICEHEGWQLGYVYLPDPDAPDVVVHAISCVRNEAMLPFHQACEHRRYSSGLCLPGRVYADGSPAWLTTPRELTDYLPSRIGMARAVGLKTAVGLPVRFGGRAIAVLELFSTEVHKPSDTLLDLMHDVSDQIGHVVERERRNVQTEARIWREQQDLLHTLHDSLGQTLTGLGLMASALRKRLGAADAAIADTSRQIAQHAESALGEIRQLAKGLFPTDLDADGLLSALRQLATMTQAMHPVRVDVQEDSSCALRDHRIATNLYRIAQEAVTNSVKHADAQTITIRIQTNSGLTTLRVSDDGRGIEDLGADVDGVGLRIMNYRARSIGATLTVAPQASGGTMVTCAVREALHSVRRPVHAS